MRVRLDDVSAKPGPARIAVSHKFWIRFSASCWNRESPILSLPNAWLTLKGKSNIRPLSSLLYKEGI